MPTDIPPATPTFTETPTLTPTPTLTETPTPTSTEAATHTPTSTPMVIEATGEVTSEVVGEVTAEAVEEAIAPIPPAMALQSQNTLTAATVAELITAITTANQKTGSNCTYTLTTITLTAASYVVTTPAETNNAFPTIACAVVINGAPSTIERDTTAGKFRLFNVIGSTSSLTLNNLTLRNGDVVGSGSTGGGAVYTSIGSLTLNNSVITNNRATAGQTGQAFGGGIYVYRGQLIVVNSTISTNQVYDTNPNQNFRDGYGGGIGVVDTSVLIQDTVIFGNIAEGQGGGINFAGSVDLSQIPITFAMTGSIVANNQAYQGGGYYSLGNNIQQAQISYSSFTGNSETSPNTATSSRANAVYAGKLVLADSCIVANGTDALRNDVIGAGSAIISAPNNWWGQASGPSGTGFSGTGERVSNVSIVDLATGQPTFKTSQPADCTQPTDPTQQIINELATYGITVVASGIPSPPPLGYENLTPQAWTLQELQETLLGVQNIANAFRQISGQPSNVTAQQIFQSVMGPVTLVRATQNQSGERGFCQTDNNVKVIGCWGQLVEPDNATIIPATDFEYTIVHEFGHVLDPRVGPIQISGQSIIRFIDLMDSGPIIQGCDGFRLMGESLNLSQSVSIDTVWKRGESGWGSGPARNGNAPNTPRRVTPYQRNALLTEHQYIQFYPVGTTTQYVDYQSDPLGLNEPGRGQGLAKQIRVEEAMADMFLNWVYRRKTDGNAPAQVNCSVTPAWNGEGFRNLSWEDGQGGAAGINADQIQPGEQRYVWMDNQMRSIFAAKGW